MPAKTLPPLHDDAVLLMAVIENAVDGILIAEADGAIQTVNRSLCKLFGYEQQELLGENMSCLLSLNREHCRDGVGKRKDGSVFPCRIAFSNVQGEHHRLIAIIIQDQTREKEAERQLKKHADDLERTVAERTIALESVITELQHAQKETGELLKKEQEVSRMKSRFVSMASHEFRSPLSSIQLSAALIERYYDRLEKDKVTFHLNKIKASVADLTSTLDDFLSVEKIESGRIKLAPTQFDLNNFIEDVCEELSLMKKPGQQIQYHKAGAVESCFLDKSLLKHCLVNLLSNAIKYSAGDGLIEVTSSVNKAYITIGVKDNGIGIPEADRDRLFDAFFRADNARDVPGNGLGLHIVKRYAEIMGGTVGFVAPASGGSKFILTFKQ